MGQRGEAKAVLKAMARTVLPPKVMVRKVLARRATLVQWIAGALNLLQCCAGLVVGTTPIQFSGND